MQFSWTDEQLEFRDATIKFAQNNLNEKLLEREKEGLFSRKLWGKCAQFGILGLPIPEIYGGSQLDLMTTILVLESLGYGCCDQGLLFSIHAHMWSIEIPILNFGTDDQKNRYLPKLCDGSWIGAHAMSEPDSGTDAFSFRMQAIKQGNYYILNGTKTFVTNAPEADLFVSFGSVDRSKGMWGVTAFIIERDTKGCTVGNKIEKMGLSTSPMAQVIFDECKIPAANVLGCEGQGATIFNHAMSWERSCILATTVGAMERQLETCLNYAKERKQFGKPIGNFQLISAKLADLKVRLETSRLLLYKAAWSQDNSDKNPIDSAIAKLYISESAIQSALDAIQIHGGYGYMKEYEIERDLRDMIGGKIYSGTSEIQRLTIARNLGLTPSS